MAPDLSILTARSKDRKSRGFYRTALQFTAVFLVMAAQAVGAGKTFTPTVVRALRTVAGTPEASRPIAALKVV